MIISSSGSEVTGHRHRALGSSETSVSGTEKVLSATVEEQVASPAPRPADAPSSWLAPLLGFPCGLPCLLWAPKTGVPTTHCSGEDTLVGGGVPEVLVLAKGGAGPPSSAPCNH